MPLHTIVNKSGLESLGQCQEIWANHRMVAFRLQSQVVTQVSQTGGYHGGLYIALNLAKPN